MRCVLFFPDKSCPLKNSLHICYNNRQELNKTSFEGERMPQFTKGQSGNPAGRPKGSKNRAIRQPTKKRFLLNGFDIEAEWLKAFEELESPQDKISALMSVMPYCRKKESDRRFDIAKGVDRLNGERAVESSLGSLTANELEAVKKGLRQ